MDGEGQTAESEGVTPDASDSGWNATQSTAPNETADNVVELRHDAGLTAGHTLALRSGKFRLGPRRSSDGGLVSGAPEAVSFDLVITPDGHTTLNAGREPVAVEGITVDRPVQLEHGDVIQLPTDHFVLRSLTSTPPRRHASVVTPRTVPAPWLPSMSGWLWFFAAVTLAGVLLGLIRSSLFGLALIGIGGIVGTLIIRSRRHGRARQEHATQLSNARSLFFNEIVDSRKAAADALRSAANTPAIVARQAAPAPSGPRLHATVASGDRAWEPPVVCHRDPGWNYREVVDELSFLPAIPFTVDLDAGPIAIVGPRLATLAVARHLTTTALAASPPQTGVSVTTTVPADWRWLPKLDDSALHIIDCASGSLGPRTVVLDGSLHDLGDISPFTHIICVHDDGRASIRWPNGETSEGFAPHGITEKSAREIVRMTGGSEGALDLRTQQAVIDLGRSDHGVLDTDRLLVTGADRSRTKNVLASAALRQAARHPDRSIFILDRGDRALIRLAQLNACRRYVAIDQIANVDFMIGELEAIEAQAPGSRVLFLAPDLWEATAFYRNSGRLDLAERIDAIVARMEILPIAASAVDTEEIPQSSFLVWINTDGVDLAEVQITSVGPDGHDSLVIDLETLPGVDLTASVARLTASLDEETSR